MELTQQEVLQATGGTWIAGEGRSSLASQMAGAVSTDTRTIGHGAWFVALVGPRFDGHAFLQTALEAGAQGAVVSNPDAPCPAGLARVVVDDTTEALQDLGRWARDQLTCPVVGITGSNGKTTTRALTVCALRSLGHIHHTVGNLNNHLGVPLTLLAAPRDADACVVEMGTSSPGEIALLRDIGRPNVALVVNVGPAHLEELGGLDGVGVEKRSLYGAPRAGDQHVVNVDDPRLKQCAGEGALVSADRLVSYGRAPQAAVARHVRLVSASVDPEQGCTHAVLQVSGGTEPVDVRLPALGEHVAHNAAGAVAVALALGVPATRAVADLAGYAPVGSRMRPVHVAGVTLLDDAYNANPGSVRASLQVVAALVQGQATARGVAVLGDMLELGAHETRGHEAVVEAALAAGVSALALHGERMARAAPVADGADCTVWSSQDPAQLAAWIVQWLRPGDVVLFKGSRGARVERVLTAVHDALRRNEGGLGSSEEGACSTT